MSTSIIPYTSPEAFLENILRKEALVQKIRDSATRKTEFFATPKPKFFATRETAVSAPEPERTLSKFERRGLALDKMYNSLSPEERVAFDKCLEAIWRDHFIPSS